MTDLNNILAGATLPPETRVVDQQRIQAAVREILLAVGEDPDRDGLLETQPESLACTPRFSGDCILSRGAI